MATWPAEGIAAAAGLAVGSYVVTSAVRHAESRSALTGRSCCDRCGVRLGFARTVPVLSFAAARGVCHACGGRIDPIHLVGEVSGAAILATALLVGDPLRIGLAAILGLALLAEALVDFRTGRLPDLLTAIVALAAAGLASRSIEHLALGLACAGATWAGLMGLRLLSSRRGRDPGLGMGDVKLMAALALWLGLATPWMFVLAALLGLAAAAVVRPPDGRLPIGPAIAAAAWAVGLGVELGLGR